jgi:ACT domain-containing protein
MTEGQQATIIILQKHRANKMQRFILIVHLRASPEIIFYLLQPLWKFKINLANIFHAEHYWIVPLNHIS